MAKVDLNRVLNINNHSMTVFDKGFPVVLKNYKNNPRTVYDYLEGEETWMLNARVSEVRNLPIPFRDHHLVVSRETLRAVQEIEVRLLKRAGLMEWLIAQKEQLLKESKVPLSVKDKLQSINPRNIERKWPEFNQWLHDNILPEDIQQLLIDIKKYVAREDLWCPGPRVKNETGDVIACRGLMQMDSFWKGILW